MIDPATAPLDRLRQATPTDHLRIGLEAIAALDLEHLARHDPAWLARSVRGIATRALELSAGRMPEGEPNAPLPTGRASGNTPPDG